MAPCQSTRPNRGPSHIGRLWDDLSFTIPVCHLRFFVLVQVLSAHILVHDQALVNGFIKHLFVFVELHKPKIFFLAGFYTFACLRIFA
jgi:hypothetical protein